MTDFGTVIVRSRSPALITTSAVMTFTMLPIGRSVLRSRLHKILPVAALARAAPLTLIPEGPGMDTSGADGAMTPCATAMAPGAPGVRTPALMGTAAAPIIARAARTIRSGRITRESVGVGTKNYSRPGPAPPAPAQRVRPKCQRRSGGAFFPCDYRHIQLRMGVELRRLPRRSPRREGIGERCLKG